MTIDRYLHAGVDAEPVADEHVEHHVVPPALVKVGQEMTERHLEKNWSLNCFPIRTKWSKIGSR